MTIPKVTALGTSFAIALLIGMLALPSVLTAQTSTTTDTSSSTEESVTTSPDDEPLERQAKLKRAWHVYREVGTTDIYAITKEKTKRAVQVLGFFTAFNANYHVKLVKPGSLARFTTGDPITTTTGLDPANFIKAPFRHRLVKTADDPAVYLENPDGTRRPIVNESVFHRFGWEFRDVEEVSEAELGSLPEQEAVTDSTVFTEEVEVDATHDRLEADRLKDRLTLKGKHTVRNRLVKAIGDPDVYVIDAQGVKHHLRDEAAARRYNINLKDTTEVTEEELDSLPTGTDITETATTVNLNETVE